MNTKEFGEWLKGLVDLSGNQRKIVLKQINTDTSKDAVSSVLDSNVPKNCPRCQQTRIGLWGRQSGLQRYRCKDCHKCFNSLSGTSLARLRHKEVWLDYSEALIAGLTVRKAAKLCAVAKSTSFRWRHRFLNLIAELKPTGLNGIVEADETFFPSSFKGARELPRPAHQRGHACCQRGTGEDKVTVLILRDRHKAATDFKLTVANVREEAPIIAQIV
jgi:transposase-like protein